MSHPSFLQLDRLALGGERDAHVEACAVCRAHVELVTTTPELPGWVAGIRPAPRPRLAWLLAAVVPIAALLALVVWPHGVGTLQPGGFDRDVTTEKGGAPEVALWIKRGERVFTWQDEEPVQPGDRLRIEVAPAGYSHVAVLAPRGGRLELLYAGPVRAAGATLLPKAWEVDAVAGRETLVVVLSHRLLSRDEAEAEAEAPRSGEAFVTRLVLDKRSAP